MTTKDRTQPDAARHAHERAVRRAVRRRYAGLATLTGPTEDRSGALCCLPHSGLGCGSPTTFARLAPGERVLDLGSGAGFDCLAATFEVGPTGRVIGIDMTIEMVRLARRHASEAGVGTVCFLQAQMEQLPFRDGSFDVVISNCVINLCPDKERVWAEVCRVLKPGGRIAIADVVALAPLPLPVLQDMALLTGCIADATPANALSRMLRRAGFARVTIGVEDHSHALLDAWAPGRHLDRFAAAARITASKPS